MNQTRIDVPAIYNSASQVVCTAPDFGTDGYATLTISNDQDHFYDPTITFIYVSVTPPLVGQIDLTTVGPGNIIHIQGSSFTNSSICRFSNNGQDVLTAVEYVNSTSVHCVVPDANFTTGNISVSVQLSLSNDGNTFVSSTVVLTYSAVIVPVVQAFSTTTVLPGTVVSVYGSNFFNTTVCRFAIGSLVVFSPVTYTSSNQVSCVTPLTNATDIVRLDLSNDGVTFATSPVIMSITYLVQPTVTSVDQTIVGPGSVVTLQGTFTNQSVCRYALGDYVSVTQATFISSTSIQCIIPTNSNTTSSGNDTILLSVSNSGSNSYDVSTIVIPYVTTPVAIINKIDTSSASKNSIISITGSLFTNGSTCLFSMNQVNVSVQAAFVNSTFIQCVVPQFANDGPVHFDVSNDQVVYRSGPNSPAFQYVVPPVVQAIDTSIGGPGNTVQIIGSGFTNTTTCKFTDGQVIYTVNATFVNSSSVTCTIPQLAGLSNLQLYLVNGGVAASSGNNFTYVAESIPVVQSVNQTTTSPGVVVSISGSLFTNHSVCRFSQGNNSIIVPMINFGCATPVFNATGAIRLEVSNDATHYVTAAELQFYASLNVVGIDSPRIVPGQTVTLSGTSFTNESTCVLEYQGVAVTMSSVYINSSTIQCTVPSINYTTGQIPVQLYVLNHGVVGSSQTVTYTQLPLPIITSIDTTIVGPGNTIVLSGSQLYNGSLCMFTCNGTSVIIPSNRSSCTVPTLPCANQQVYLSVSNDGYTYVNVSSVTYTSTPVPVVSGIDQVVVSSGSTVIIAGSVFLANLTCRYTGTGGETTVVIGVLADSSHVVCPVPTLNATVYTVSVSNDGQFFVTVSNITVLSVVPPIISTIDATSVSLNDVITIQGSSFTNTTICKYSNGATSVIEPAIYINASVVQCRVPASNFTSSTNITVPVSLTLSNDGVTYSSPQVITYTQLPVPTLTSLRVPIVGPGTVITVSGSSFYNGSTCRFTIGGGIVFVDANYVNPNQITCQVPTNSSFNGTIQISVSSDGILYTSSSSVSMVSTAIPTVSSINTPVVGPGSVITVTGTLFTPNATCFFNQTIVPAVYVSSTTIQCPVPSYNVNTVLVLAISNDGLHTNYEPTSLTFVTVTPPVVQSIDQANIQPGDVLTIYGTSFSNHTVCRFSSGSQSVDVNATYINSTIVQCNIPKTNFTSSQNITVDVLVTLSNDGVTYTSPQIVTYTQLPTPSITSINTPVVGPGTVITVTGSDLYNGSTCRFTIGSDTIYAPAIYISTTQVTCTVPNNASLYANTSQIQLALANIGTSFTSSGATSAISFTTVPIPVITGLDKTTIGPDSVITVTGTQFGPNSTCRFSNNGVTILVPATYVDSSHVQCDVPNYNASTTLVLTVSNDGIYYSYGLTSNITFVPVTPPYIASIDNTNVSPGSNLVIHGSSFTNTTICKYTYNSTSVYVNATFVSDTEVYCAVPVTNFTTPTMVTVSVIVSLSNDGTTYTSSQVISYTQLPTPTISGVDTAIVGPGSVITVSGSQLYNGSTCRFAANNNTIKVPATYISATIATCTVPSNATLTSPILLSVSNAGSSYSSSISLPFTAIPIPIVSGIDQTTVGPGSIITVTGSMFGQNATCIFSSSSANTMITPAIYIDSTHVQCDVPNYNTTGILSLSISNDGSNYDQVLSNITYVPHTPPFIQSIDDMNVQPGGVLTIHGTSFTNATVCKFTSGSNVILVPANFTDSTTITCVVPTNMTTQTNVTLPVQVTLSNDGSTYTSGATPVVVTYTVLPVPTISSISTSIAGPGNTITIQGSEFVNGSMCRFTIGTTIEFVRATYTSSYQVSCQIPTSIASAGNSNIQLAISNDGMTYVSNNASQNINFSSVPLPSVSTVSQTVVGPSSVVTVTGTLFEPNATCKFSSNGTVIVLSAVYVSNTQVQCPVPIYNTSTSITLSVSNDAAHYVAVSNMTYVTNTPPTVLPIDSTLVGPGNTVIVIGSHFTNTTTCKFTSGGTVVVVQATAINSTAVSCPVPASNFTTLSNCTQVILTLSNDGTTYVSGNNQQPLTVVPVVVPLVLSFDKSSVEAGDKVSIYGMLFVNSSSLSCKYTSGSVIILVPATYISSNEVSCVTPTLNQTGSVVLSVSNDGVNFVSNVNSLSLGYTAKPNVGTTSVSSSTSIIVQGTQFTNSSVCRFTVANSIVDVSAMFVNSSYVECPIPPLNATNATLAVQLQVSNGGNVFVSAGTHQVVAPAPTPTITSIDRSDVGPGSTITIQGTQFTSNSSCIFTVGSTNMVVTANYVNSTAVTCIVPIALTGTISSTITLQVTNDGKQYSGTSPTIGFSPLPIPIITKIDQSTPGSSIIVQGSIFLPNATCRFTSGSIVITIAAVYSNASHVSCTTPVLSSTQQFTVEISNDGIKYSVEGGKTPIVFATPTPTPTSVQQSPQIGYVDKSVVSANTILTITGSYFTPTTMCQFTQDFTITNVQVTYINSTAVQCTLPDFNYTAIVKLALSNDQVSFSSNTNFGNLNYIQGLVFSSTLSDEEWKGDSSILPNTLGPPQTVQLVQTTPDDPYGSTKLQISSIFNTTSKFRRAVMSTGLFPIIKQESFIDFSIDNNTLYGNMVESWLFSSDATNFIQASLQGDSDKSRYIQLGYNLTRETVYERIPCSFSVDTHYRLLVRATQKNSDWIFEAELWLLQKRICYKQLIPSLFQPEKFFTNKFRVILSQSNLGVGVRRSTQQTDTISMTIYVNSIGLQCQAGLCGNMTLDSIPYVEKFAPVVNLLVIFLVTAGVGLAIAAACVLVVVLVILVYCRRRAQKSTLKMGNISIPYYGRESLEDLLENAYDEVQSNSTTSVKTIDKIDIGLQDPEQDVQVTEIDEEKVTKDIRTKLQRAAKKLTAVRTVQQSQYGFNQQVVVIDKMQQHHRNRRDSLDEDDLMQHRDSLFTPVDSSTPVVKKEEKKTKQTLRVEIDEEKRRDSEVFTWATTPSTGTPIKAVSPSDVPTNKFLSMVQGTPGKKQLSPLKHVKVTPTTPSGVYVELETPSSAKTPTYGGYTPSSGTPQTPRAQTPVYGEYGKLESPASPVTPIDLPKIMEKLDNNPNITSRFAKTQFNSVGNIMEAELPKRKKGVPERIETLNLEEKPKLNSPFTPVYSPLVQKSSLTPMENESPKKRIKLKTKVMEMTNARKFSLAQRIVDMEETVKKRNSIVNFDDSDSDEDAKERDSHIALGLNKMQTPKK
jgi:hypothetical protein